MWFGVLQYNMVLVAYYSIFKQAIEKSNDPNAKPEMIIKNVYEIRRTKFGSSTENVRAGVNKRFDIESQMALQMLNQEGNKIDTLSSENKNLKADARQVKKLHQL
jgi:hypothetical protein